MPEDLRELVRNCLAGDQSAMARLVERFRNEVFGLCLRMLGDRHDAEDAAQETFVRVLRALARWDPARPFRPWLLAIAGNRCRTVLASRTRRPPPLALVADYLPDGSPDAAAERQLVEEVDLALEKLREEYRKAFLLYHDQELSYAEIGEVLDCPVGTVKTWVHRARRELAAELLRRGAVAPPCRESSR